MNSESMRVDVCLLLIFFLPQFVEFETCVIVNKLSLQLVLEASTWGSCSSSSHLSTFSIYVVCVHNVQYVFVLFCYVEKLVKGLLKLHVGLLCLTFKFEICCTFVLLYCAFVLVCCLHMHCAYC